MPNQATVIIEQQADVEASLVDIGLTTEMVIRIAQAAIYARREHIEGIDAASYPGAMAYFAGIRTLRLEALNHDWVPDKFRNIEVVVNHSLGVMIGYQNVDRACTAAEPQAISRRGEGTKQLVSMPYQNNLFVKSEASLDLHTGAFPFVWFVCVAADENLIQVEVSRPKPFEGEQFAGFYERIFVANERLDDLNVPLESVEDEEVDDLDIVITKKTNASV